MASIRERLSSLSRGELVGLVALLAVALGGAGLWYLRSLPKEVAVRAEPAAAVATSATPSPTVSPPPILVDVSGWVRHPGVYEFHEGDRVIDAIEAAGGARPGAGLESLNLAAPLADGTQILVPKAGAAPTGVSGGSGTTSGSSTSLVNINTGSASDFEALPGIGEVISQRIVDYRTQNGPFASVDQLEDVSGIGEAILAEIRDLVTV